MLTGLMDHWVPSHDGVSRFWKLPFHELAPAMSSLCDDIGINHFTFYTKWFSNGIHSSLPFLHNHPLAQNTLTDNAWGRQWIDFFHGRGMTVGAMLQCYWFENGALPREGQLRCWPGTSKYSGLDQDNEVANPLWADYDKILEAMLTEHIQLFPNLDAIFLEFEGVGGPLVDRDFCRLAQGAKVSAQVQEQWERSGWSVAAAEHWVWTPPVQRALRDSLRQRLATTQRVLDRLGFKGIRGVVYHAMNYESPLVADCLADKNWWLLPWHYWGWDEAGVSDASSRAKQIAWCLNTWNSLIRDGHHLCYIGNATLPTTTPEIITQVANACREMGAAGYLGMGNPIPNVGLRWLGASEDSIAKARALYSQLFPPSGIC